MNGPDKKGVSVQFHIDRFTKLGGAFIVHGWSDNFRPGDRLTLAADGVPLETITPRAHQA